MTHMGAPLHHIVEMCMLIATHDTHEPHVNHAWEPHVNLDSLTVNAAC